MDHLERYRSIIPDFDGFLSILALPLPTTVRINTLKTDRSRISIKAKTSEKLGFIGREEGLSAYAIILLQES